jgi:pSer/pThr/pTyr-binding forkhead associated (FHA) protein
MALPLCPLAHLTHIHGSLKGTDDMELADDVITIGRNPSCTVAFPATEPGVSREHARIEREGLRYKLTDLSRFGTFVNGRKVTEAFLASGDVVEFGPGGPRVRFMPASDQPVSPEPQVIQAADQVRVPVAPGGAACFGESEWPELQKIRKPLIIQYGQVIGMYHELPVFIGSHAACNFVLQHAGIFERHARIYFHQNGYVITDLTGQRLIRINGVPIDVHAELDNLDEIALGPRGPNFRFLSEGRLAEVENILERTFTSRSALSGYRSNPTDDKR